ncbi:hypothetical protein BP428_13655 [Salmonella enterica]|nr:hypothetical protein [Salmonella enterica]ECI4702306.1 hypothetical protein [Salmonella enterica subsp. salamae]
MFDVYWDPVWLATGEKRGATGSGGCAGKGVILLALSARNKNASRSGWHFASWMYTMRQRSYATAYASMGTMTLA